MVADAGRPLRAGESAAAARLATDKAKVEGLRSKLKLLAARGWLAGAPGGLFTLPDHAGKAAMAATGVIEGACRHLIADRPDIGTGATSLQRSCTQ